MYRSLYTGSMPRQMPLHAYAEWKGCLHEGLPRLGARTRGCLRRVLCWMVMYLVNDGKPAYATLPMQQISTLLPRVPTHAYMDCKISGRQPKKRWQPWIAFQLWCCSQPLRRIYIDISDLRSNLGNVSAQDICSTKRGLLTGTSWNWHLRPLQAWK